MDRPLLTIQSTMSQTPNYTERLQQKMGAVGLSSFRSLARQAGVSLWPVRQLRQGKALELRSRSLLAIAETLQVSLSELIEQFSPQSPEREAIARSGERNPRDAKAIAALQEEYARLQAQMDAQRPTLEREFQRASLDVLESWLLQWPTAARAARENPQIPAGRLLPLVSPVEALVRQWGIEAIAEVGAEIPYDPQQHQLMDGTAEPGDRVRVRYVGYKQGETLLYRAKVSPIAP